MKLLKLLAAVLGLYLLALSGLVIFQERLLFHPRPLGSARPADFGVPNLEDKLIPVTATESTRIWWLPKESKAPTLLYCHGNSASLSSASEASAIFQSYGWNVLLFEYRGYGNVPPPAEGISESSLQDDARASWRWLMERGVDPHSVIIWGYSLGSTICAALAAEQQAALLILEGAFPSIEAMAHYRYPWARIPSWAFRNRLATASYVQNVQSPILIIHGQNDRIVPFFLGQVLFHSIKSPASFLDLGPVGHTDFPKVHRQFDSEIQRIVGETLAKVGSRSAP